MNYSFLTKIIILITLITVMCSLVTAFKYNNKDCSSDPDLYFNYTSDISISGSSYTYFDLEDITTASGEEFILYMHDFVFTDSGNNHPVIHLLNDTDSYVYSIVANHENDNTDWFYEGGSGLIDTNILATALVVYNITTRINMANQDFNLTFNGETVDETAFRDINTDFHKMRIYPDEVVNITTLAMWNCTDADCNCPTGVDTTAPTLSSFNITSANVVPGELTDCWPNCIINITSNLLTATFTADESSNCSCRLDYVQNYSTMITANANYKLATTDTTSHSVTLYDDLNITNHTMYCSCVDGTGNEDNTPDELKVTRWQPPYFSPVISAQSVTSGTFGDYNITCLGNGTLTMTSNYTIIPTLNTTGSFTGGNFTFEPFYSTIGLHNIKINCSSIYGDNVTLFGLTVSACTGGGGNVTATQHEGIEISLPSGRRLIR